MPDNHIPEQEDAELLALLNNGDKKAFEMIYDRYADSLYQYVYSRVPIKEESEKIIQNIFVWLWDRHGTLAVTTSLRDYLFSALKHSLFKYFASEQASKKYADNFSLFVAGHQEDSCRGLLSREDIHSAIEKYITELPEKCQTVFRLNRIENLSIQDIALRMNIPKHAVEDCILQGLKHLRLVWRDLYKS